MVDLRKIIKDKAARSVPKDKSLAVVAPEVAAEWHPTLNGSISPADVSYGSQDKAYWLCQNGHDYDARINNRVSHNSGCPFCSGRRVLVGYNDLTAVAPEIAAEWHPEKNGDLKPSDFTRGSAKRVWWLCPNGHDYDAKINDRVSHNYGCPFCSDRSVLVGYNDLATVAPEIAAEWHPQKNGDLKPSDFTRGSVKRVWWLCPNGHDYDAKINDRVSHNTGCPFCSGRRVLVGYSDLATVAPEIAAEWHPEKNGDLKPSDFTRGSVKRVWWLCPNGHDYEARINDRVSHNYGCPFCSGHSVLVGYNDLATVAPEIAAEWHPEKNGDLKPSDFTRGSGKRVWWLCPNGHDYAAVIKDRVLQNSGCPFCSGRRVLVGYNDLATVAPEIAAEWHPTKNGDLSPRDVTKSSNKIVWWICPEKHEYDAAVYLRTKEKPGNCPYCSGRRALIGYNDLTTVAPEIAAEWHPTLNGDLKPTDVTRCSNTKVWWLCPQGHEYQAVINNRTTLSSGCPYCSGCKALAGYNDLCTVAPEIAAEWHPTLNGDLKPTDVTKGSGISVWWHCPEGHDYQSVINSRVSMNYGCPFCSKHQISAEDTFSSRYPELLKEWDFVNNYAIYDPNAMYYDYSYDVWWICSNNPDHHYKMSPHDRIMCLVRAKEPCPYCKGRRQKKSHFI